MPRLQDSGEEEEGSGRPQNEHVLRRFSASRFQYAAVDGRTRRGTETEREEAVTADVDRESATTNLTAEMVNCRND